MASTTTSPFLGSLILDRFVFWSKDFAFPKDDDATNTLASITNSRGHEFRICFKLLPPPRVSRLYLQLEDELSTGSHGLQVLAAHRHALLLQMTYPIPVPDDYDAPMTDYFLYTTAGGRPSLQLLPPLDGTIAEVQARIKAKADAITNQHLRRLEGFDIGVLCRRGDDDNEELAVAELEITGSKTPPLLRVLCLSKSSQWEAKHPPVIPLHCNGEFSLEYFLWYFDADTVVPFQGTYLCWVDYCLGILFCDVFHDSPELRYMHLPAQLPMFRESLGRTWAQAYQAVGVTDGGVMKFVKVACANTEFSETIKPPTPGFTVTSWILRITTENNMEWEQDAFLTSDQLWDLDGFAELPRTTLQFPVVSMDDPGVVYFLLMQNKTAWHVNNKFWIVAIDMSNKTLKSSFLYITNPAQQGEGLSAEEANYFTKEKLHCFETFLPTEFSKHLNLLATRTDLQAGNEHVPVGDPIPGKKRKFM